MLTWGDPNAKSATATGYVALTAVVLVLGNTNEARLVMGSSSSSVEIER
ncbi:hypothetical protein PC116_g33128 [Phytophthora cactorum]|nr:hypothetical protein PC116_g33128 [Phytophthora cactorum]